MTAHWLTEADARRIQTLAAAARRHAAEQTLESFAFLRACVRDTGNVRWMRAEVYLHPPVAAGESCEAPPRDPMDNPGRDSGGA